MFQGNKLSAGAIIKLKTWERMDLHGIFCEDQNEPWGPRTLGSDYVPEERKEGTVIYAEEQVWIHISSAYGNWAKADGTVHKIQACEKNQLTSH